MVKAFQNILYLVWSFTLPKELYLINVTKIPFYFVRSLSASFCKDLDNFIVKGEQHVPKDFKILFPFKRRLILFQNGDHRSKFTVLHFLREKYSFYQNSYRCKCKGCSFLTLMDQTRTEEDNNAITCK